MNQPEIHYKECFELLKNILLDAFNVSAMYFTSPYEDIDKIDMGIRAAAWTNYSSADSKITFGNNEQAYRIIIVQSNLGFYNMLITLGGGQTPDFIAVGPFRDEELSPNYFVQIFKDANITPVQMQSMKHIYELMPLVTLDAVINVTRHVVGNYFPEFKNITPDHFQYSEQKHAIEVNTEVLDKNFIEFSTQYRDLLLLFFEALKQGDSLVAKKALNRFLQETKLLRSKNTKEYKMNLQTLNDYCHMALLDTSIHPFHILKQSYSIRAKIETMTSLTKLEYIPGEICHKYCLLVKNYAHPEYSRQTKDMIAYIQLHLEEELNLSMLAEHFGKNASVLSNAFSKETGQTLTNFIHQIRIQEAVRLINTTNMSVSEIALAVGYQDFSYFSKIFVKHIGMSPREYRKGR